LKCWRQRGFSSHHSTFGANLPNGGDTLAEGIAEVKGRAEFTRRHQPLARSMTLFLVDERHLEVTVSLLLQIERLEGHGA
jgi:hypothetical protein